MIELKNISKIYKMGTHQVVALDHIDLSINTGELTSIMGPSGAGKSTCMDIIGLLERPSSGQYLVDGKSALNLNGNQQAMMRNKMIGFVFQGFFLLPKLTALQNVALPLLYRGVARKEALARAQHVLEQVAMGPYAPHHPTELSGGQAQRVAIARALVGQPKMIIADEPTGALDSKTSQKVMDLLIDINRRHQVTVMIVTHDMDVAKQCNRIIRIKDGKIVEH